MPVVAPYRKVMAILNVTPDSFYSASRAESDEAIALRVAQMVAEGADIIDIGGYSTRPGAAEVAESEECRRVMQGVEMCRKVAPEVTLSIDTFRASVAESVLTKYDNVIINDITAGEADPRLVEVVAHYGAPMVAMHTRGTPQTMARLTDYDDVVREVVDYLDRRAEWLQGRGVSEVILDPGFGFAKTVEQNFELLGRLGEVAALGLPVLAGISRKSFIYKTLDSTPEDVLEATSALHWACLDGGAAILRVHDTAPARQVIRLYEKTHQLL